MKAHITDGLLVLSVEYEEEIDEVVEWMDKFDSEQYCGVSLQIPFEMATVEMTGDEIH